MAIGKSRWHLKLEIRRLSRSDRGIMEVYSVVLDLLNVPVTFGRLMENVSWGKIDGKQKVEFQGTAFQEMA